MPKCFQMTTDPAKYSYRLGRVSEVPVDYPGSPSTIYIIDLTTQIVSLPSTHQPCHYRTRVLLINTPMHVPKEI